MKRKRTEVAPNSELTGPVIRIDFTNKQGGEGEGLKIGAENGDEVLIRGVSQPTAQRYTHAAALKCECVSTRLHCTWAHELR